jgi:sterol desaturase/sphingolipid hydroxylase (fatty acid hydroxylase superfamily)
MSCEKEERTMFALEHSKLAYWTDLLIYAAVISGLALCISAFAPSAGRTIFIGLIIAGFAAWSLIEYLIHRFVLHGIEPFRRWHTAHHERPTALIGSPTVMSASLIFLLVFLPAWAGATLWEALSVTLGVTAGYLAYALCHHATHHWRPRGAWLAERKRWHAVHHRQVGGQCYGVTSALWDHVFGTAPARDRVQ